MSCKYFCCSYLTSIVLPEGVTWIGDMAFFGCSSLRNIEIPKSVTYIGGLAFEGCYNLNSIIIPEGVTSIDDYAFQDCSRLTSFTCLATNPPSLGSNVFNGMNGTIFVPAVSVEAYKAADGWKDHASQIQAIP